MTTLAIRKKLTEYLQTADDKKVKAIYALVEDEINLPNLEYDDALKQELDSRYSDYTNGAKMITADAANKAVKKTLQS